MINKTPFPLHCNEQLEAHLTLTALSALSKAEAKPIHRVTESCEKSVKTLQDFVDEKEPSHD